MRRIIVTSLLTLVCAIMLGQTNTVQRGGNKKNTQGTQTQKNTYGNTGTAGKTTNKGKSSKGYSGKKGSGKGNTESKSDMQESLDKPKQENNTAKRDAILANLSANMVLVEGGQFEMGATKEQGKDAKTDESPKHKVTVNAFAIGRYEVTQEEWEAVMGYNNSETKGDKLPVVNVTWTECQQFLFKLKQITGITYRLPTEAEWEYAARGGANGKNYKYAGGSNLSTVGWFSGNSQGIHPVGEKLPNELGLFDMSGNAMEWCADWYSKYKKGKFDNPKGPDNGTARVYRGGGWMIDESNCRVSARNSFSPDFGYGGLGFRLAQ